MKLEHFNCNKPGHFLELYEQHLKSPKRILEIGVQTGRSLSMWKHAFPDAYIVGLDIESPSMPLEEGIEFVKGSQLDSKLLQSLGRFDLIVDDGAHFTGDQIHSFNTLFNQLESGGQYVIEDLETSYQSEYINSDITAVDYLKTLTDRVNQGRDIKSMLFARDIVLIEKL